MWNKLPKHQKDNYRKLITNFASLSEAFAQKADSNDKIAPIINSKFQETAFQRSFNAQVEDISNSSYDASVISEDNTKYLVGIKSFGVNSGDQKVAQFKSNSVEWTNDFDQMRRNAKGKKDKEEVDSVNNSLYLKMARTIANLRNKRILSSKAQIRGFKANNDDTEDVYHVLMPSKKGDNPKIYVGETSYSEIDINNLNILGATSVRNPENFIFFDGKHRYKYTAADSQLYMSFDNKNIIVDSWDVKYIDDAFRVFENLSDIIEKSTSVKKYESYEWPIIVQPFSGFNAFYGNTKMAKKDGYREHRICKFRDKYKNIVDNKVVFENVVNDLKIILLNSWKTTEEKFDMVKVREKLMSDVSKLKNNDLAEDVCSMVYRPTSELYIPIANSREFHNAHPDFFGKNVGTFKEGTNKLALPKEKRIFTLRLLPSGDEIKSYINQDNGKAIQSIDNQEILGEWILRKVFQLKEREPLTKQRLDELGISGLRLSKIDDRLIGLEFI
ncbi:hypothetical protein [Ligilactobacillus ruminis]|uniref:hypothetical protein n=1 Tax=Ligilactobacillus ruminis TaxID=1623 RepID=UPI0022E4AA5C|nr:hypothetical protein [Ligilactobacillus ruminis]